MRSYIETDSAMRLQRQSDGQILKLDAASVLGHGGEARVFPLPQDETLVAKVYHKPTDAHAHKLIAMLKNPPDNPTAAKDHISIAWPADLLRTVDTNQPVVGFLMPRVKNMHSLLEFYNPKTRRQTCPFFNYLYLHRTARNLAAAVGALHVRGYCIGDVNESNILVSNTALVTLVDTDSFQVPDSQSGVVYRCPVGKPEFTPPELQGKSFTSVERTPEHDLFGLAVLIFQLLMEGTHPFSGVYKGVGEPPAYSARIAAGHFTYSRSKKVPYEPMPIAPSFNLLHPSLQELFWRCFEDGHRNPQTRPNAQLWQNALNEAENALLVCSLNSQHRYGNHLKSCPWCERTVRLAGRDPFPSRQAVQKGQHLQPIPRKRTTPPRIRPASPQRTLYLQSPLITTITIKKKKTNKKFVPLILSSVSAGILGLAWLIIIISNDFQFSPEINGSLFSAANNSDLPNRLQDETQGSSVSYNNQGNIYYKLGDYEEAIANFSQALRINPKDAKAYVNRGNARYEIAQHSGDPDKNYKAAIDDFNQALKINSSDAKAYFSRGVVRYEIAQYSRDSDKDYKAALADFSNALNLNPKDAKAYVKRGIVKYKLAQFTSNSDQGYREAIKDLNQALIINSQEAEAYVKRGIIRYELAQFGTNSTKDYWAAVADLQKAAKLFLEQGDIDRYQQALNHICVVLEKNCNSFLRNPEKFIQSGADPFKQEHSTTDFYKRINERINGADLKR